MPESIPPESGHPFQFDCFMAPNWRTIPADGAWVTVNGFGRFVLTFYTDAPPLPKTIVAETTPDGLKFLNKEPKITPVSSAGTVRQYEASIIVSLDSAKLLANTLRSIIEIAEKAEAEKQGAK